jgi:hypothetical protein
MKNVKRGNCITIGSQESLVKLAQLAGDTT